MTAAGPAVRAFLLALVYVIDDVILLNGYASAAGPSFDDLKTWGLEGLNMWGPGHSRIRSWRIGDMKTWGWKDVQI